MCLGWPYITVSRSTLIRAGGSSVFYSLSLGPVLLYPPSPPLLLFSYYLIFIFPYSHTPLFPHLHILIFSYSLIFSSSYFHISFFVWQERTERQGCFDCWVVSETGGRWTDQRVQRRPPRLPICHKVGVSAVRGDILWGVCLLWGEIYFGEGDRCYGETQEIQPLLWYINRSYSPYSFY